MISNSQQPTANLIRGRDCINDEDYLSNLLKADEEEKADENVCDPSTIDLSDYDQWVAETGYWIGEYTFLKEDGSPFTSANWPYPYNSYKGFITGNIRG